MKYAGIKSVLTLAKDFVITMLFAQFQTMLQDVIVSKVMSVIHYSRMVVLYFHAN